MLACNIIVYSGKKERSECLNYRRISELNTPEKIYGKIFINRVAEDRQNMWQGSKEVLGLVENV